MSDWIDALREECRRTSQAKAATRIGYSGPVVNQVLKGKYKGDLAAVEMAVRGALLAATVTCPVLGEIASHRCREHQQRPLAPTNQDSVRLYRACRAGCPHSRLKGTEP